MKKVVAPDLVGIILNGRAEKISFKQFLTIALDQYEALGKGVRNIRMANKLASKIETSDKEIDFEDAEYEIIEKAIEEAKWNPAAARQLLPFFEVIEKAKIS